MKPVLALQVDVAASVAGPLAVFDVGPGRRAAARRVSLDPAQARRCQDDETGAEIGRRWACVPPGDRRRCARLADEAGAVPD